MLSVPEVILSIGISSSFFNSFFNGTDTAAAANSKLGILVCFKVAREDFPTRKEQ